MAVYRGYPWRFVVTDLLGQTTTWADGLFTNRKITFNLNAPSEIDCDVYPNDKRVNFLFAPDGFRLVAQSNRIIYAFRRENPDPGHAFPWVCRAAGIIMSIEDQSDTDTPLTSLVAYDPWKYLEARPCVDGAGNLPGPNGFVPLWPANRPEIIAINFLVNSIAAEPPIVTGTGGNGCFIDFPTAMGGTAFYGTTTPAVVERCSPISMTIQQGESVAALWSELCSSGVCDIVLFPVWDPINRPGYTHEVGIYNLAGVERPSAIFGWDRYGRSTRRIDRMHSAVPGDYFNKGQYFTGQGGWPTPVPPYAPSTASISDFLVYWTTQFSPSQPDVPPFGNIVEGLLVQAVQQAKQGKRTIQIDTIPERSPNPLIDYSLGDRVIVHATDNLRAPIDGPVRVEAIPIDISDDGIESVSSLLVAPDWRHVGPIATASVGFGGINYVVGDTGTIDAGNALATYVVQSVDGLGGVLTFTLSAFGDGYMLSPPYWPTETSGIQPGAGSDFQVNVTALT